MKHLSSLTAILLVAASAGETQQMPPIRTTVDEVVLDVVVRDKKGKQVRELGSGDFEVLDNGIKQTIRAVRLVEGKEATGKGAGAPAALDPLRQIRLVTLVFDRLS